MPIVDKEGILKNYRQKDAVVIELGCGTRKMHSDSICIDLQDYPCVDIVGDAQDVLKQFMDETVSAVYAYHFFEHLEDISGMMTDLCRVLRKGGSLEVVTPHFSSPYYYSDYTHKTNFGLYSFCYFCENDYFSRKTPRYLKSTGLDLSYVKLIFKSTRPFYLRWAIKKIFGALFNSSRYMMELYEENFCYVMPCYEILYRLVKVR